MSASSDKNSRKQSRHNFTIWALMLNSRNFCQFIRKGRLFVWLCHTMTRKQLYTKYLNFLCTLHLNTNTSSQFLSSSLSTLFSPVWNTFLMLLNFIAYPSSSFIIPHFVPPKQKNTQHKPKFCHCSPEA